jgi:hypothetical protein
MPAVVSPFPVTVLRAQGSWTQISAGTDGNPVEYASNVLFNVPARPSGAGAQSHCNWMASSSRSALSPADPKLLALRNSAGLDTPELEVLAESGWWLGNVPESLALSEDLYRRLKGTGQVEAAGPRSCTPSPPLIACQFPWARTATVWARYGGCNG